MKSVFAVLAVYISVIILTNCDTAEPPPLPPAPVLDTVTVNIIAQTHRSITVEVKTTINNKNWLIELWRNYNNADTLAAEFPVMVGDTTIIDDNNGTGLQEGTAYNYYTVLKDSTGEEKGKSEKTTGITVKPTSHEFSYEYYEFGGNGSCTLYDVAIINENDIWAVGEIYTSEPDSNGNDRFNAVHWDGNKWELKRVLYNNHFWDIKAILAFSSNDIWFEGFMKWDGENFIVLEIPEALKGFTINAMWGTSSRDIYVVGNQGAMAHYDGNSWSKINNPAENGVDGYEIALADIYGDGKGKIVTSGVNHSAIKGIILNKENENWKTLITGSVIDTTELFTRSLYGLSSSIWIDENGAVYAGGNFLYKYKNGKWNYVNELPANYIEGNPGIIYRGYIASIRGNASNDYIVSGDRNTLMHYNGKDFKQLGMPYDPESDIIWGTIKIKSNLAVAVGRNGSKAALIMLRR